MKLRLLLSAFLFIAFVSVFTSCEEDEAIVSATATEFVENSDGSITIIDKGEGIGTKILTADKPPENLLQKK